MPTSTHFLFFVYLIPKMARLTSFKYLRPTENASSSSHRKTPESCPLSELCSEFQISVGCEFLLVGFKCGSSWSSEMMNVIIPTSSQYTGKDKQYHYHQKTFRLRNREEGPWRGEMTSCSVLEWSPKGTAWSWGPSCHTSRKQEEASLSGNTLLWHLSSCWHILKGWWLPLLRSIYGSLFRRWHFLAINSLKILIHC